MRQALIVAEIAFALVLLTGAGLFLRGLQRVANDDLGWRPDGLLMANFELQGAAYTTPAQRLAFYSVLEERLRAVPGVERVALAGSGPPVWGINNGGSVVIDGRPEPAPGQYPNISFEPVSLHYFDTLEIRLLAGRTFNTGDKEEHVPVAIVSETLARQFWPNESAIGKRFARVALIRNPPPRVWLEVVGVVNDVAFPASLGTQPNWRLQVFRPMAQMPAWPPRVNLNFDIIVRAAGNPEALGVTMRRAVAELDSTLPLTGISAVRSQIDRSLGPISLFATLLGAFATLGLMLAAIGIYGVTSYAVVQRTQEFGLRMALGAQAGDVLRLILAQSARLTVYGMLLGVGGAYAVARLLMATVPTVPTRDPLLAFGLMLALAAVAMIASYTPARRATLIDPLVALRHE